MVLGVVTVQGGGQGPAAGAVPGGDHAPSRTNERKDGQGKDVQDQLVHDAAGHHLLVQGRMLARIAIHLPHVHLSHTVVSYLLIDFIVGDLVPELVANRPAQIRVQSDTMKKPAHAEKSAVLLLPETRGTLDPHLRLLLDFSCLSFFEPLPTVCTYVIPRDWLS